MPADEPPLRCGVSGSELLEWRSDEEQLVLKIKAGEAVRFCIGLARDERAETGRAKRVALDLPVKSVDAWEGRPTERGMAWEGRPTGSKLGCAVDRLLGRRRCRLRWQLRVSQLIRSWSMCCKRLTTIPGQLNCAALAWISSLMAAWLCALGTVTSGKSRKRNSR